MKILRAQAIKRDLVVARSREGRCVSVFAKFAPRKYFPKPLDATFCHPTECAMSFPKKARYWTKGLFLLLQKIHPLSYSELCVCAKSLLFAFCVRVWFNFCLADFCGKVFAINIANYVTCGEEISRHHIRFTLAYYVALNYCSTLNKMVKLTCWLSEHWPDVH